MKNIIGLAAFLSLLFSLHASANPKTIVALGDSITAGYGVSKEAAYPALLEKALIKKGKKVKVVNAGISGATTASAIANLKWQLRRKFDVLIICLGGNDGLRGLPVGNSEKNLAKVIEMAKSKQIKVVLAGMQIPKNYGADYRKKFLAIFPRLAKKYKIPFMPFLLKDVAAKKDLNLADGIHPNEAGYKVIAENVLPFVEALL